MAKKSVPQPTQNPLLVWLEANGRNQRWLATKLAISESVVSRLIAGHAVPRPDTLLAIQTLTGVGPSELLTWRAAATT